MSKKASRDRQTIRKQYTGQPGRPREIEINGGGTVNREPIKRLSATDAGSEGAKGVQRLSASPGGITYVSVKSGNPNDKG